MDLKKQLTSNRKPIKTNLINLKISLLPNRSLWMPFSTKETRDSKKKTKFPIPNEVNTLVITRKSKKRSRKSARDNVVQKKISKKTK